METAYAKSKTHEYDAEEWVTEEWEAIKITPVEAAKNSGVKLDRLRDIGLKISTLPAESNFHRLVRKIFE